MYLYSTTVDSSSNSTKNDLAAVLGVYHCELAVLVDVDADVLHGLLAVVVDADVDRQILAMAVHLVIIM